MVIGGEEPPRPALGEIAVREQIMSGGVEEPPIVDVDNASAFGIREAERYGPLQRPGARPDLPGVERGLVVPPRRSGSSDRETHPLAPERVLDALLAESDFDLRVRLRAAQVERELVVRSGGDRHPLIEIEGPSRTQADESVIAFAREAERGGCGIGI